MTKQLLIMRHAKSSWADAHSTDHQRSLNARGLRDAPRMGQLIESKNCVPDLVLCSTARRACETARLLIEHCDGIKTTQLELLDEFYHANPAAYMSRLAMIDNDDVKSVMIVGHNPGLEELVFRLSGEVETMSTAAIAVFELAIESWAEIRKDPKAKLLTVWRPKEV